MICEYPLRARNADNSGRVPPHIGRQARVIDFHAPLEGHSVQGERLPGVEVIRRVERDSALSLELDDCTKNRLFETGGSVGSVWNKLKRHYTLLQEIEGRRSATYIAPTLIVRSTPSLKWSRL
jgi:hypothetical protein